MIRAKKSLGQNFLTSSRVVRDIISAAHIQPEDYVVEVGPGKGILTQELLASGATVLAIEKDDRLLPLLEEKFSSYRQLKKLILIHGDALTIPLKKYLPASGAYKLVANIPYYITGQLLRTYISRDTQPTSAVILVQKEVAERIVARDNKESLLSLSIKCYGTPRIVRMVKRTLFQPAPNVDSAVIAIETISKKLFSEISEKKFFDLLHAGFASKRKMLLGNLRRIASREILTRIFVECEIDEKIRAEDMHLDAWLCLAKNILH